MRRRQFAHPIALILALLSLQLAGAACGRVAGGASADKGRFALTSQQELGAFSVNTGGIARAIPDQDANGVSVPLVVARTGVIVDAGVSVRITHPRPADLSVTLEAPGGARISLFHRAATGQADLFEDYGYPAAMNSGLTSSLRGGRSEGTWRLKVVDAVTGEVGRVESFAMHFVTDVRSDATSSSFVLYETGTIHEPIPDDGERGIAKTFVVSRPESLADLGVSLRLTHAYPTEIRVRLIANDGRYVDLTPMTATTPGTLSRSYGFPAEVRSPLFAAWIGKAALGVWTIQVIDQARGDVGYLEYLALAMQLNPAAAGFQTHVYDTGVTAQTIPDDRDTGASFTFAVNRAETIAAIGASIRVRHPRVHELVATLTAPNGDVLDLPFTRASDALNDDRYVAAAGFPNESGGNLAALVGRSAGGLWNLNVRDRVSGDVGEVEYAGLLLVTNDANAIIQLSGTSSFPSIIDLGWSSAGPSSLRLSYAAGASAPSSCAGGTLVPASGALRLTGLSPATDYQIAVCFVDAAFGLESAPKLLTVRTATDLPPVNPLGLNAVVEGARSASLSWTSGGATTAAFVVKVQKDGVPSSCAGGVVVSAAQHRFTDLVPNSSYHVRICGQNVGGQLSSGSATSFQTPIELPPSELSGAFVKAQAPRTVTVAWTSGGGSTDHFLVALRPGHEAPVDCAAGIVVTASSYTFTFLDQDMKYAVRICASNFSGVVTTGVTLAFATPSITPNESFVRRVFREATGREPEQAAVDAFVATLDGSTAAREAIARSLYASDEYRARTIRGWYRQFLARAPAEAEIASWQDAFRRGVTQELMIAGFADSPEYFGRGGGTNDGWVRFLYRDLLHREADDAGLAGWVVALDAGQRTRGQIAHGFMTAREFRANLIDTWYCTYLGRHSDAAGQASWTDALIAGVSREEVQARLAASDEYFQGAGGGCTL